MTGSAFNAEMVAERLDAIRHRISTAGGEPASITVVAVTKGFGPAAIDAAVGAGVRDIGENYASELLSKVAGAPTGVRWHFLGALQRNKLARLAPHVHLWHGLDGAPEALALARRRPGAGVLVEVKLAGPAPRLGVDAGELPALVAYASDVGLQVRGLMAVAPRGAGRDEVRRCFHQVARLARSLDLAELSMGMSADFELAVAEGATIIRIGRALFGERPTAVAPGQGEARLR